MTQVERRRRFVVVECPYCREGHDVLVDGGRQKTPCGREMEALKANGGAQGQVWGLAVEGGQTRRARVVTG